MRSYEDNNDESRKGMYITQDMFFVFDREGKFLDYQTKDPALLLIPPEKFLGKYYYEVMPENLIPVFKDGFDRVNSTGEFEILAYNMLLGDERKYQEALLIPSGTDRIIAVIKDVTESIKIQKVLAVNEEYLKRLVDNISNILSGVNIPVTGVPQDYLMSLGNLPIFEREKFVWELLNSENRFRTLFESSPIGIAIGINGKFLQVNRSFAEMYGYDDPSEMVGLPILDRIAPENREAAMDDLDKSATGELTFSTYQRYGVKKDGTRFPMQVDTSTIRIFEGNANIAFIADMTEIVNREEKIKASLHEKEILLKEIHHRVKNNLQIISSMLSLQADLVNSQNYMDAFNDSRDRVRSMAIIHEKLYQSGNFASIAFGDYAIDLINYLYKTYWTETESVEIDYDLDPVFLPIDLAIPCGLILNELVSNAFKYAFMPGRKGTLKFLLKTDGVMVTMTVKDNGKGFPKEKDLENTGTLGLTMVKTLIMQLNGNLEIKDSNGAEFIITFQNSTEH